MTLINLMPEMAAERSAANEKVREHFNRLALASLHDDLVAIARGAPLVLLDRETRKAALLASIEAARTPAEIENVLSTL